jgi:DNA-binding NtrC family response regulator
VSFPLCVLIISKESPHRCELTAAVAALGLLAICCESVGAASGLLDEERFAAAFCICGEEDLHLGVREVTRSHARIPIVVVSRRDDWDSYLRAMSAGAFDYVATPLQPGEVERVLQAVLGGPLTPESRLAQPLV